MIIQEKNKQLEEQKITQEELKYISLIRRFCALSPVGQLMVMDMINYLEKMDKKKITR